MLHFELDLRRLNSGPCILGWEIGHEFVKGCSQSLCSEPDWGVVFVEAHGVIEELFDIGCKFS